MQHIKALGFDLFDTLITVAIPNRREAPGRMLQCLQTQGIEVDATTFFPVYHEVVSEFLAAARQEGKESHNRFWISTALQRVGQMVEPDDHRIAEAVEAYFSAFLDYAVALPGTHALLDTLKQHGYRLGLLSNLTHAPAARQLLAQLDLAAFFDVLLVSGDLGYRKPHPAVFRHLIDGLDVPQEHIAFIGDDVDADIHGAQRAGLQPIWTCYARSQRPPQALEATPKTSLPSDVPTIDSWEALLSLLAPA